MRAVSVAKRSAVKAKTQAIIQLRALLVSAPQEIRDRLLKAKTAECVESCKDLTVAGSTIAATNDVGLQAGGNLTIGTTQNTSQSSTYHESSMTGIGASDGLSYGTDAQKVATNDQSTTQVGSLVGSTNGSVNLAAGSTLHITGSDVLAAQNITGTAANVTIDSAVTTQHHDETQESKTSGLTLGATDGLISLAENTSQEAGSASKSEDSRAAASHVMGQRVMHTIPGVLLKAVPQQVARRTGCRAWRSSSVGATATASPRKATTAPRIWAQI